MRRALSWGVPLFAAVMTGVFVGKELPDNTLRAAGDPVRSDTVKVTAAAPTGSQPPPASGNASPYAIPAPIAQPKHLFHLIIRYEGEGLPDQSMLASALTAVGQGEDEKPKKAAKSKTAQASKAAQKSKDAFQVIIRYEGDGIIDDNVAKVLKDYFAAEKAADAPSPVQDAQKGPPVDPEPSEQVPPAPRSSSPTFSSPVPTQRDTAPTPRGAGPTLTSPVPDAREIAPAPRRSAPTTPTIPE